MRVTMIGPPGSGKGTQGELLAAALSVPHVVSSDLLREAQGDSDGRMASGDLVDDQAVIDLVLERLGAPDCAGGFLLDGFPRDTTQATALDGWLAGADRPLEHAVLLDVPEDALLERLEERAAEQHRDDDGPQTRRHRLDLYRQQTAPVIDYYRRRGVLRQVDAAAGVDEVARRVRAAVDRP